MLHFLIKTFIENVLLRICLRFCEDPILLGLLANGPCCILGNRLFQKPSASLILKMNGKNKFVLLTDSGSIGSELSRQCASNSFYNCFKSCSNFLGVILFVVRYNRNVLCELFFCSNHMTKITKNNDVDWCALFVFGGTYWLRNFCVYDRNCGVMQKYWIQRICNNVICHSGEDWS